MKPIKFLAIMPTFAVILLGSPAMALADEDLDVTMTVLEEGAEPESAYSVIELPVPAGKSGAVRPRDERAVAGEAQQHGAEKRTQALEAAREAVGNDVARGVLNNLPHDVRNNIPQRPPGSGNQRPDEPPRVPPPQN